MLADAPLSDDPFGPFLAGAGFTFLADHQRTLVDDLATRLLVHAS